MDIKATRKILVGTNPKPLAIGAVAKDVDDAEAKALIAAGYATEVKGGTAAKANDGDTLATVLDGSVDEVVAQLDNFTVEELVQLRDLEAAGKNRKGIADAIGEYDLGGK